MAESEWSNYSPSDKMGLSGAIFPMTIKGIARTCMGELFDDQSEVERLSHAYHSCWKEMEVWQCWLSNGSSNSYAIIVVFNTEYGLFIVT